MTSWDFDDNELLAFFPRFRISRVVGAVCTAQGFLRVDGAESTVAAACL